MAAAIWEKIEGKKGGLTYPCSPSALFLPFFNPFWADAEVTPAGLRGGPQSGVKRFKWLGLTQLNVSNSLFVFGWSSLRSASVIPLPPTIPYSFSLHLLLLSQVWEPTSWLLLEVKSENYEYAQVRELRDRDTIEHRDAAWRAVSPSGGLIFSMGGPRLQCEYLSAQRHMFLFGVPGYRQIFFFLKNRLYCVGCFGGDENGRGPWCASVSFRRCVRCGGIEAPKDCSSGSCGRFHWDEPGCFFLFFLWG